MSKKVDIDDGLKLELITRDVFDEIEHCGDTEGKYIYHLAAVYLNN